MKKKFLLVAILFCIFTSARATQYMVMVANFTFTPSSFSMHLGDTVMWMWSSGTHTTTSTTIPSGAASWNSNIDASTTTFMYVPTKLGTYHYQCNFHVSSGMIGSFTVTAPTNVPNTTPQPALNIYPNPAANQLFIQFNETEHPASVLLSDLTGKTFINNTYSGTKKADINIANVPNGVYIITVQQNNVADRRELIVNH